MVEKKTSKVVVMAIGYAAMIVCLLLCVYQHLGAAN